MNNLHVKSGDTVVVLSGADKGRQGKVLEAFPAAGTVVVEGVHITSRHTKPRKQGEPGGIIKKAGPIKACKVMRVCTKCDQPTRPAAKIGADGAKTRICKKCGAEI